jgi:hypothetical protein
MSELIGVSDDHFRLTAKGKKAPNTATPTRAEGDDETATFAGVAPASGERSETRHDRREGFAPSRGESRAVA